MKIYKFETAYSHPALVDIDEVIGVSYYNGVITILFKNGAKIEYHVNTSYVNNIIDEIFDEKEKRLIMN